MRLDGSFSGFGIVLGHKNDTMEAAAKSLSEAKLMARRVSPCALDQKLFHDHVIESGRPFRPSENAVLGRRQFHRRGPNGTGFSVRGRSHRPSAQQRQPGSKSGPGRTQLERSSARRHLYRFQESRHRAKRVVALAAPLRILQLCFQPRRPAPPFQRGRARTGTESDGIVLLWPSGSTDFNVAAIRLNRKIFSSKGSSVQVLFHMDVERRFTPETMEWIRQTKTPYAVLSLLESDEPGEPTAQANKSPEQPVKPSHQP